MKDLYEVAIKAVIYDVDGTMVNSEPIHVDAWDKALQLHDSGLSNLPDLFRQTMAGKKPKTIAEEMVNELRLSISPEQLLEEKTQLFVEEAKQNLEGMPGIVESVERFHAAGYKLGIGTSLDRTYLNLVLSKLGLTEYFDVIVTGDQIQNGKPDPETYIKVAEQFGVPANQCVVLEDAESGIRSAKSAGAYCIAIENKDAIAQNTSEADFVVASLNDISVERIKELGSIA